MENIAPPPYIKDPNAGFYTSCIGFTIRSIMPNWRLVTDDIASICRWLDVLSGEGYHFLPEDVSEGGIMMVTWPKKREGAYKTFQFRGNKGGGWPRFNGVDAQGILDTWKMALFQTIFYTNTGGYLELKLLFKAYCGAPSWTKVELERIELAFAQSGFRREGPMIREALLIQYGYEAFNPPSMDECPSIYYPPAAPSQPTHNPSLIHQALTQSNTFTQVSLPPPLDSLPCPPLPPLPDILPANNPTKLSVSEEEETVDLDETELAPPCKKRKRKTKKELVAARAILASKVCL